MELRPALCRPCERWQTRVVTAVYPLLARSLAGQGPSHHDAAKRLLYQLVVLFYAEGRGLLPINKRAYQALKLQGLAEEIAARAGENESEVADRLQQTYSDQKTKLHQHLACL